MIIQVANLERPQAGRLIAGGIHWQASAGRVLKLLLYCCANASIIANLKRELRTLDKYQLWEFYVRDGQLSVVSFKE